MAETFNPFHKWLGLKPNIKNPHHFQLLGVNSKLVDDAEIKIAVQAGVKRNLERLARVPPNPKFEPVVAKLKQRIAIAQKTLADPKLRAAYKLNLKSQIEAAQKANVSQKKDNGHAKTSTNAESRPTSVSDLLPPAATPKPKSTPNSPAVAAVPAPPASPAAKVQTPPVQTDSAESPPAKPAIPLAIPLSPGQMANVATATSAGVNPTPPAAISPAPDLPILNDVGTPDVGEVKINKKRRKRKRSILAPLMMLMMIGAGGVGLWFIIDNFDALKNLGKKEEVKQAPVIKKSEKLKPVDPDKLEELDEDKIFEEPDSGDPDQDDPKMVDDGKTEKVIPEVVEPKLVSLDESQLARFRRSLERGHRSLFRRNHELATEMFRSANEIATEVLTGDDEQFIDSQKPMIENVADSSDIMNLLKGFWKQVHDSAESISGAQEIIVGSQIVGFVESKPNSVIVRRSGGNIEYGYDFCPPGLALALAEQGAVADVPTWSKQKAAFYAVDQIFGVDHRTQIDSFLKTAEAAGHDCESIRRFSDFSLGNSGRPSEKVDVPDKATVDLALTDFRSDAGYENIRKLDPTDALKHAQLLMQIDSPNFEQHVAILEEARELGIRGGDATIVEDALIELSIYSNANRAELTCDSFAKIAEEKITPEQVRDLMERSIGFLNSPISDGAKTKTKQTLIKRLLKLSERAKMPDAYRRLNQIKL